jgi:RNA polymerase sigma-70 factor (ECF subfamily)
MPSEQWRNVPTWERTLKVEENDMEWTADIELRRKGNTRSGVNGPNALGAVTIQDCVTPSLKVKGGHYGAPDSLGSESMALSSVAVAERSAPMVMDQNAKDAPVLRHEDASEEQLLEAARSGDERAFGELIGRCVAQVRHRIFRIVGNRQDAEDALQDSLLRAYIHLDQFRGTSRFSTWLHRIAINSAVMLLRKRKVPAVISSDHGDDLSSWETWDVPDRSPNPEQIYAKRQALEGLSSAVERLPSSLRSVIDKVYEGECSVQEAADAIGISVAATKSRLQRARLRLRWVLKEQRLSVCGPSPIQVGTLPDMTSIQVMELPGSVLSD